MQLSSVGIRSSDAYLGALIPEHYHYQMLLDRARMEAFREAIELVVSEGARVVDLGAGTGVLSCFAARAGAQVWAIEKQPDLARTAARLLRGNGVADRVQVIPMDARDFVPDEPVDLVICEMLHSALLREHQVEIVARFQDSYLQRFESLPTFLPTATLLGVEPVLFDYSFLGYAAPLPVFEDPGAPLARLQSRGAIQPYAILDYETRLPERLPADVSLTPTGNFNALRFTTNNVLAIRPEEGNTVDWMNQNLILPVAPQNGRPVRLRFEYEPGSEIAALAGSLELRPDVLLADEQSAPQ